jgi:hypothetical protein
MLEIITFPREKNREEKKIFNCPMVTKKTKGNLGKAAK